MDTCKYIGNLTTPLSMLFIGVVIHSVKIRDIRPDRGMAAVLIGRFLITPFLAIVLCRQLALPLLMKKVFVIQAAMPVMTQTSIIAEAYGADYEYAAVVTTVTTIISLVSIPFYMFLLGTPWIF
jgi:predicted permease